MEVKTKIFVLNNDTAKVYWFINQFWLVVLKEIPFTFR